MRVEGTEEGTEADMGEVKEEATTRSLTALTALTALKALGYSLSLMTAMYYKYNY